MDDDIVRFMVATDNHLGYGERDPVRCNDSFASFEEVLKIAKKKKVDFILLAGDLFHENKPSRRTLHATMELLRKYCLNNDPVFIEILNEQEEIFKSSLGRVNYEDPFQSIGMPIFAIHGNHDDPSREGGSGESLAALDLLAVSNLINYYGKADNLDGIEVTPVLIKKGNTKIALYGLGAIRDERLNRMWNMKKVKFVRLTEDQGRDEFFNIFVLHQNRDYGRGSKNCIHESMIPSWMDLVIWGNEHECQPQLMDSLVGDYRILQPGSSIACSLSKPESAACPKHMVYFEVKERKFRIKPIKFQQIRQFLYDEVSLQDESNINPTDPKVDEKVWNFLKQKVDIMIREARLNLVAEEADEERQRFTIKDPEKVLIRLRLEHDGFAAVNQQRFGSQYVGAVANPSEILLLAKKRKDYGRTIEANKDTKDEIRQIFAAGVEEEISKIKIEDLVKDALSTNRNSLSLLLEDEMAQALDDYIMKKQNDAILDVVSSSLDRIQRQLARDQTVQDGTQISSGISRAREQIEKQKPAKRVSSSTNSSGTGLLGSGRAPAAVSSSSRVTDVVLDMDDVEIPKAINKGKGTSSRSTKAVSKANVSDTARKSVRATKSKAKYAESDDEDEEDFEEEGVESAAEEEDDDDQMSIDESEEEKPKKKVTKAKAAPKPTTRKAPAAKKSTAKKNAQNVEDDDIVDSDEVSLPTKRGKVGNQEVALPPPPSLPPSQATQGKTKRMLPLSFSQVSTTSKGKSNSKTVDLSWDD